MGGIGLRLAHASRGRIRWKVDGIKHNIQRAKALEEQLRSISGVVSVEVNPLTASLLLTYEESTVASMEPHFSVAKAVGISLNDLDPDDLRLLMAHDGIASTQSSDSAVEGLETAIRNINARVQRTTGMDLGLVLPLALAVLGIRGLAVSEKTIGPSWYDYLWFAFSTYFMLHRTPPVR